MNNDKRMTMLREMPIPKLLLKMGIPTMIGMLITGVYSLIDAFFVGGLGTGPMAAVSVAFPLGQLIVGIAVMFGGGAAAYISRLLGKKDYQQAGRAASTALYSSLIVGTVAIAGVIFFMDGVLRAMGATDTVLPFAEQYAYIYVISSIFNIFNVTMNNISAGEGAAKISMLAMLLGAALNTVFAPILIYPCRMGITGAAVATALAQGITAFLYVLYILKKKSLFSFSPKNFSLEPTIIKEILKIGIPMLVFQLITGIAIGITNTAASRYGDSALAALGIVTRITAMASYAIAGFAKGFQPVAGYNFSAKLYGRLQSAIRLALIWTTAFALCLTAVMLPFANAVVGLFAANNPQVIGIAAFALRVSMISILFMGMEAVYSMLSLSLGKALGGWILSIGRQGVFFIPLLLLLPQFIGLHGVIYAQPIADVLTAAVMLILAVSIQKDIKKASGTTLARA